MYIIHSCRAWSYLEIIVTYLLAYLLYCILLYLCTYFTYLLQLRPSHFLHHDFLVSDWKEWSI